MAVENSTVLIIVNNWGIEETELTRPLRDLKAAAPCRYIAADIENAGGHYVDEQLHVDDANGFKLITSRKPADLDYFVDAIKDALN